MSWLERALPAVAASYMEWNGRNLSATKTERTRKCDEPRTSLGSVQLAPNKPPLDKLEVLRETSSHCRSGKQSRTHNNRRGRAQQERKRPDGFVVNVVKAMTSKSITYTMEHVGTIRTSRNAMEEEMLNRFTVAAAWHGTRR